MGRWSLLNVTPKISVRKDKNVAGHMFEVSFRLKYTPSKFGSYTEMPRLEWKETIKLFDRYKGSYWVYAGDQYERNPSSHTFKSWISRYVGGYNCVYYQDYGKLGYTELFDVNGGRLKKETFGQKRLPPEAQVDAVLGYAKSHGCILEIPVRDSPAINRPAHNNPVVNKERFLTFDCGLKGMGRRIYAYQHLVVSSSIEPSNWTVTCGLGHRSFGTQTTGLKQEPPPKDVTGRKVVQTNYAEGVVV